MADTKQRLAFIAFTSAEDTEALKAFLQGHNLPPECAQVGDITTATEFLRSNPSPELLLVEVSSAEAAPALLDKLADVCDESTKVIITGMVNEYSFYRWLMEMGVFDYLLRPLRVEAVETLYQKAQAPVAPVVKAEKQAARVVAVMGARGGVGASSIALNLAGLIAEHSPLRVALVDVDAQDGCLALSLDVEPSRGIRESYERPERIDDLFTDRALYKVNPKLSVLCPEEPLQERLSINEGAAAALMKELRAKFDLVVLDMPRHPEGFARQCLAMATQTVLVCELTLASLRDTLRISDMLRDGLGLGAPLVLANRAGIAAKHELKTEDFEKGIGASIAGRIPFAPDLFMAGNGIPTITTKQHAASKALHAFAGKIVPEAAPAPAKKSAGLSFLSKSKKE